MTAKTIGETWLFIKLSLSVRKAFWLCSLARVAFGLETRFFKWKMNAQNIVFEEGPCFRTSDYLEPLGGEFFEVSACDFLKKFRCTTCMSNSVARNQLKSFKGVLSTRDGVLTDSRLLVVVDCFLERNVLSLRVGPCSAWYFRWMHCNRLGV